MKNIISVVLILLVFCSSCNINKQRGTKTRGTQTIVIRDTIRDTIYSEIRDTLYSKIQDTIYMASQGLMDTVQEMASKQYKAAEQTLQRATVAYQSDTNSLAKELVPIIQTVKDSIQDVQNIIKSSNFISVKDVTRYMKLLNGYDRKVCNLIENLDLKPEILKTDVIFGLGKYKITDLTYQEKEILNKVVTNIINFYNQEFSKNPDAKWKIKIQTTGHSDEQGFKMPYDKNELVNDLEKDIDGIFPNSEPEKRKFLNKRLSLYRAQSLNEFFKEEIKKEIGSEIEIEVKPIGLGEKEPNKKYITQTRFDSKDKNTWRKIVIIQFYVIPE